MTEVDVIVMTREAPARAVPVDVSAVDALPEELRSEMLLNELCRAVRAAMAETPDYTAINVQVRRRP